MATKKEAKEVIDPMRLVVGILECASLGALFVQVADAAALGKVEAQQLVVNHKHYIMEGKLTPFPHIEIHELSEQ